MSAAVTTVLADDLTGACEIAGVAHRRGLDTTVALNPTALDTLRTDLLVADTETRLASPEAASATLATWLAAPGLADRPGRLFKKTDSVLRGPVAAELNAVARHLGSTSILLVTANPALGRTVSNGISFIQGAPLHTTAFAHDPHHPARTSVIREMVHHVPNLNVGDALSEADLNTWARDLAPSTLAAGSSAFFDAILRHAGHRTLSSSRLAAYELPRATLLLSGTTAPAQRTWIKTAGERGIATVGVNPDAANGASFATLADTLRHALATGPAILHATGPLSRDPDAPAFLHTAFAHITRELVAASAVNHLLIEGGATAASVAEALGWQTLRVVHEWAPGVVTLAPDNASGALHVTLKPGSYPWPAALKSQFLSAAPAAPRS